MLSLLSLKDERWMRPKGAPSVGERKCRRVAGEVIENRQGPVINSAGKKDRCSSNES